MQEQRSGERRHGIHSGCSFPFTDVAGQRVSQDRRQLPDRRWNNISLTVKRLESLTVRNR